MSSYRYRFVGYEKLPSGRNADAALKMPSAMLKMLCEQLGIHSTAIASLKSLYSNADRTISNHRAWVREQLLFSTYDSNAEARLQAPAMIKSSMRLSLTG